MNRILLRILALILIPTLLVSFALVASTGASLARDIAYYEVTSSSYDQAVGVPFVVTIDARDTLHDLVTDNITTLAISSNSHTMVFDSNNNGIFGEASDNAGVLSYGRLYIHARDTVAARGAIITVTDSDANKGSSDAYAISPTTVVSADGWAWQNPLPQGIILRGISGRSSEDIYAVGDDSTILHYNGRTWMPMSSGTANNLYAVWASSSSDVFAAGDAGVMHYDGVAWTLVRGGNPLRAVWGTSPSDVFAVGDSGVVIRYDGTTWTEMSSGTTSWLWGVWGSSPSDIFAVGDNGTILHYDDDGVNWTSVSSGNTLRDVWGTSPSNVFAVGDTGTIWHYDGATWTAMSSGTANNLYGVWGSSPSDIFAVGDSGTLLHYDGETWTAMSSGTASSLQGVWGSPTADIMAVGSSGVILHREGGEWLPMSSGATGNLNGIWGSSSSDVFAAGDGGTVLHYDGSDWTGMDTGTTADLVGIWGSSSSDVFAVGTTADYQGIVLHYDGSGWTVMTTMWQDLRDVWGTSPNDVFAVGESGIQHYDGNIWSPQLSTTTSFGSIWGSSSSDVFATTISWGSDIRAVFHYDGISWSNIKEDPSEVYTDVWGSSSSDVFVGGLSGFIMHYDGSTWTQANAVTGYHIYDIWGSSSSDVFAAGNGGTILHYDGNTWTTMDSGVPIDIFKVWGTSSSDIFVVGDGGAILHYPEPAPSIVNTVTPSSGELGETLDVVVNGSNLEGATTLTFGLGVAVTVNSFTAETPSQITASITIAADAAVGARNVYAFTGNDVAILYSGFMVNEATPPPPAPEKAARSWWLGLWILLGILGAGMLGGLAFFLSKRLKKGPKPAKSGKEKRWEAKPERKVERVQARKPVIAEKPTAEAAPIEPISVFWDRLSSQGRHDGAGRAATGETSASDQGNAAHKKPVLKKGQSGSPKKKGRKINRPEVPAGHG